MADALENILNHLVRDKPLGEQRTGKFRRGLMVLLGNAGVFGAGMALAVSYFVIISPVVNYMLSCEKEKCLFDFSDGELNWFSSIFALAGAFGALLGGYLMDRFGRKKAIFAMNIFGVMGWTLFAASSAKDSFHQILVGMSLCGIMIGMSFAAVSVYSAEISLPRKRYSLVHCTYIAITIGLFVTYLLLFFTDYDWQLIGVVACLYQIFSTFCLIPMPETPYWLMQKGREDLARKSLRYFRGIGKNDDTFHGETEAELAQIKQTADFCPNFAVNESLLLAVKSPEVYRPLRLTIGLFAIQQLSGVLLVEIFAPRIVMRFIISTDLGYIVLLGGIRVILIFFVGSIFEKRGLRKVGLRSISCMFVFMLVLVVCHCQQTLMSGTSEVSGIFTILHIIGSSNGLLTLPFIMISEVFPQRIRGVCSGLSVCFCVLITFAVLKIHSIMQELIGTSILLTYYGCVSLVGIAYIYYLIPETRGRTLTEIEEYFRTGQFGDVNVKNITKAEVQEVSINM